METSEAIASRCSVREYSDEPVVKQILEKLVDAGRRAATARAVEPWEFVVITERRTIDEMASFIPNGPFLPQVPACIVIFCKDTKYFVEDGCAATENILLAAADLGLGTCWIAGHQKDYCDRMIKLCNAPVGYELVSIIAAGWPVKPVRQHKKRKLQDVIHWEKF